jgi:hypothetical protein
LDFELRLGAFLLVTVLTGTALAASTPYELRGEKQFSNEIDGHKCKQLFVKDREVAWVFGAARTDTGLIVRVCKKEAAPYQGAADPGTTFGGVLDGWYVVDMVTGKPSPLSLPQLTNFSNPVFCGPRAAYWGIDGHAAQSLVVADLRSKEIVKSVPIAKVELETDYMYHLASATWNKACDSATFNDERYIKATVIHAKSN